MAQMKAYADEEMHPLLKNFSHSQTIPKNLDVTQFEKIGGFTRMKKPFHMNAFNYHN